jgi:hypothetical protein
MRALELDALNNSHPIEVPVGHPSEVDEIFDAISYSKVRSSSSLQLAPVLLLQGKVGGPGYGRT